MEKRHNTNKEFAIGSKIEYMSKLYEVVERQDCNTCSINKICSNNDVPSGNNITGVLSRDKRISIFGECSSIARSDGKSVVFAELSTTKEQDVYNVAPLYKTNNELMSMQINVPNNYVIDKENSDLSKGIIKFKSKWLTLEQLYKLAEENNFNTYRDSIKNISGNKLLALANLMDIARYFNGDWKYDVTKENVGYIIAYDTFVPEPHYSVRKNDSTVDVYYGNPMFKNEDDAKYVISNPMFRTVLDKIFKV